MAKFDVRCPPWALPREEVPIQVKIEKTATGALSEAVFELPDSLRLADTINILEWKGSDGRLAVRSIGKARHSEYDYFGLVVATKEPFEALKKEVPVKASFVMEDGTVDTRVTPVRIFRPRLEFADMPDVLVLHDDGAGDECSLPVGLKFSGFGDIVVRAKCTMGGSTVSRSTSALDETLESLLRGPIGDPDTGLPDPSGAADGYSAALFIAKELREGLLSEDSIGSMLSAGRIDMDEARLLSRLAGSGSEKPVGHARKAVPAIAICALSDAQDRTLGDRLKMESRTVIVVPAELFADRLVIEMRYADALGNEYGPITRAVRIDDRRSAKTGADLEVPLAITADESGAYMNVGEMTV